MAQMRCLSACAPRVWPQSTWTTREGIGPSALHKDAPVDSASVKLSLKADIVAGLEPASGFLRSEMVPSEPTPPFAQILSAASRAAWFVRWPAPRPRPAGFEMAEKSSHSQCRWRPWTDASPAEEFGKKLYAYASATQLTWSRSLRRQRKRRPARQALRILLEYTESMMFPFRMHGKSSSSLPIGRVIRNWFHWIGETHDKLSQSHLPRRKTCGPVLKILPVLFDAYRERRLGGV